jgi:hypothetical protein
VSLGKPVIVGNETRIPVVIEGDVVDVRGMKLAINGQFCSFLGAEKGSLLQEYETPVMVMNRAAGRDVFVDVAVVGLDAAAVSKSGDLVWLRFAGDPRISLKSVEGRTSRNSLLAMAKKRGEGEGIPTSYDLAQNYPNPFNPTTTIEYQLPQAGHVTLEVFNILGERVATLVSEMQDAGYYSLRWDGKDDYHRQIASGMYIYRLKAGDFSSVKKMLMIK